MMYTQRLLRSRLVWTISLALLVVIASGFGMMAHGPSDTFLIQEETGIAARDVRGAGIITPTFRSVAQNDSTRSLAEFYARRAYPGAPPIIPHTLTDEADYGGRACLRCHNRSRYVRRIGAYTPITPHPELLSCRSCHVLPSAEGTYSESAWQKPEPPVLAGGVLPTSPPAIPHSLQLRENCLVCHSGPGSVPVLRTSHPERLSCRQCHVASSTEGTWVR